VRYELAPAGKEYVNPLLGMQLTGASTGISAFQKQFREAGLLARTMLINAAAAEWRVPPESCSTQKGYVTLQKSNKRLSYGRLAAAAAKQPVPQAIAPAPAEARPQLIGRRPGRPTSRGVTPGSTDTTRIHRNASNRNVVA
jgi:isoquinoline 1-oxidoreductase beta subunit